VDGDGAGAKQLHPVHATVGPAGSRVTGEYQRQGDEPARVIGSAVSRPAFQHRVAVQVRLPFHDPLAFSLGHQEWRVTGVLRAPDQRGKLLRQRWRRRYLQLQFHATGQLFEVANP